MTVSTQFHVNELDQTIDVVTTQDEKPILDAIKDLRDGGFTGSKDMRYVGHLPNVLIEQYLKKTGISMREFILDDTHLVKIFNDPDYKHLRVWEGRI